MSVYYEDGFVTLYHGDCMSPERVRFGQVDDVDAIITDPPYGDTSLAWDRTPAPAWLAVAGEVTRNLWCFGSMRFWLTEAPHFFAEGWRYGQEVVWEKHNGSSFHADRFKRVHELALHWYRGDWKSLHREPPVTFNATRRAVRRKHRPPHTGDIGASAYVSEDGGPKLMRSVLQVRSEHGRAVHPTQKPLGILRPLIEFSVPAGGVVLDPFAGSGSTLLAARELGRRAVGFEAREDYCEAGGPAPRAHDAGGRVTAIPFNVAPVVTDGAGDRYRVVGMRSTFTLQNEETMSYIEVDDYTLRILGLDLQPSLEAAAASAPHRPSTTDHRKGPRDE
jgi:site-specific DNA-methyltransferase (adenine-specific)